MKSKFAVAGLYSGFFTISFALCMFLTFDGRIAGSMLEQAARRANVRLSFEQAKMSGILGLELRGVEISALNQPGSKTFAVKRLKISPKLSALPGALFDLRRKRPARVAFNFSGWLADSGQRNIGGRVDLRSPAMEFDLDLANLPMDQIPAGLIRNMPVMSGKLNARVRLKIKDRAKPATWDCALKLDLIQGQVPDFFLPQLAGMKIPGFNLGNAALEMDLKSGAGSLKTLRLSEGDLIADVSGTIALPEAPPISLSTVRVEVTGKLDMGEDAKKKLPILSLAIPAGGRLNYSGQLGQISQMMSAAGKAGGAPGIPGEYPGAMPGAEPPPGAMPGGPEPAFDPMADPLANP